MAHSRKIIHWTGPSWPEEVSIVQMMAASKPYEVRRDMSQEQEMSEKIRFVWLEEIIHFYYSAP